MNPIKNIEKILKKIKTLEPTQFNFEEYITSFDKEENCGTVCCIIGWMPQWFPNCGIFYGEYGTDSLIKVEQGGYKNAITSHLITLVGLSEDWIDYLFYGYSCPVDTLPKLSYNSSLEEVIDAWEKTINYFKNNPPYKYSLT